MDIAVVLPPDRDDRWTLAKQMGVTNAVIHPLEIGHGNRLFRYEELLNIDRKLSDAGINLCVVEGGVPVSDVTRLGLSGRDEEIEKFIQLIKNLGALDVSVVCYDWMAGPRWARTSTALPARGDSLVTGYDNKWAERGPRHEAASTTPEELWSNLQYFLDEVVPVAEDAGVTLALHPDDPPRQSVRGVPRIINSPDAYERVMEMHSSPRNGITFCQGNFAAMGVDIPATIRRFQDHIAFVHFRDVEGDADRFVETWHDNGPTDMSAAMEAYADIGFDGPIRPDHVPTLIGESNQNPGYESKGRLFAVGYMRGLLEQTSI